MRSSIIELLDIYGTPIANYQSQQIQGITKYYNNKLISINDNDNILTQLRNNSGEWKFSGVGHNLRFILVNNQQEKQLVLKIEPIKCYIRDQDMNAKVLFINPYCSVGWLRNKLEKQRNCRVKLVINQKDLNIDSESLIKHIYQQSIIHVIETSNPSKQFTIYTKQPGAQQKPQKLQGIQKQTKISELAQTIQKLTNIPIECLYLVYTGKILQKNKSIGEYFIGENACVYAVDARKYLKKVSMEEYKRRVQEVRKIKECNKPVMAKILQENQLHNKGQSQTHTNSQPQKTSSQKIPKSQPLQKHDTLIDNLNLNLHDNNKYFPQQSQMNIDSPQFTQFEKYGRKIQQRVTEQNPQIIKRIDSTLQHGRIVTNQSQVYQDQEGNFHQHNYQKSVYRNGYKTVDTDITQDAHGNIIKIQKDIINLKKNSVTGQVIKTETDIIQDVDSENRVVVKKEEVRDRDGNIVKYQTKKYTEDVGQQMGQSRSSKTQRNSQQSSQIATISNPQTSEQKLIQLDKDGNIRTLQTQLIQSSNKVIFVNKDQLQDQSGTILTSKTGIIQISSDSTGNIHKHKSQLLQQQSKVTIIQSQQILDKQTGKQIAQQKDIIQIRQNQQGDIIKKQTDIVQDEVEGETKIIIKEILEDSDGNILETSTKVIQYRDTGNGQIQVNEEINVQKIIEGVQGGAQVQKEVNLIQDQQGNKVRTQRQYTKDQNGQSQLVTTYTLQNPDGQILTQKTETITVQHQNQDQSPKILRYTTNYALLDDSNRNKIILQQNVTKQGLDGSILKSDKQKIQIQSYQDGTRRTSKTQVMEQGGSKIIYIKNQLQDYETGRLISKSSDVYQLEDVEIGGGGARNAIKDVQGQQQQQGGSYIATVQKSSLNRVYNVNEDGNLIVTETQTRRDQGIQNVTKRQSVFNQQGEIIHKFTGITQDETLPSGQTRYTVADIVQQGNLTTVIEKKTILDSQGNSLRTQTGTIQIQKLHDGLTRKQKQTVVQQQGIKVKVHKQAFEDQYGNLLQQQITTTQLEGDTKDAPIVTSSTFKRKVQQVQQDQQGNYIMHHREIDHHGDGSQTVTQSQIYRNQQNQLIKAVTDVTETKDQQDGNLSKYLVNIVEKPGKVTIAQSEFIENVDGQKLKGEVSSLTLTQGQNDEITQQETLVTIDNYQKTIIQKIIVQDSQGNIISQRAKSKTIFTDQDGTQQQRQQKSYQAILQKSSTNNNANQSDKFEQIQKQISIDENGNTITIQKRVVQNAQQGSSTVVQNYTIQNIDGEIIGMNTRIFNVCDSDDNSIIKEQNQVLTGDKLTKNQIIKISDSQGNILQQNQRRVQVSEQQGLIKTKQINIQRKQGETIVGMLDLLHDQDGNLIDRNTSSVRIRDSQQAVRQKAQIVAQAELLGEIIQNDSKIYYDQSSGNKMTVNSEVIDNQGNIIKILTKTIENQEGQLINSKTQIIQSGHNNSNSGIIDNSRGPITTTITQQGGYVQVVQVNNNDNDSNLLESITSTNNNNNNNNQLSDLLGLNDQPITNIGNPAQGSKIQVKMTNSIYNSGNLFSSQTKPIQFQQIQGQIYNAQQAQHQLLTQPTSSQQQHLTSSMTVQPTSSSSSSSHQQQHTLLQPSTRYQVSDLLTQQQLDTSNNSNNNANNLFISTQMSNTNTNNDPNSQSNNNYKNTLLQQQDYINTMPQQYDIIAIDKKRNQYKLKVRYDQIIDQVRKKLCILKGMNQQYKIHFFKNGDQLNQYDMISQLDIGNGDALYFTQQTDQ